MAPVETPRGSKRVAECPADDEKPCKQAKTNVTAENSQSRWAGLKAMLSPWRWFSKDATPPKSLKITGCTTKPELNGVYKCAGNAHENELDHKRPTYVKEGGGMFCYFWYDKNDEPSNGWYFADEVASEDYLAFNTDAASLVPPEKGWVVYDDDASAFVLKVLK